MRHSRRSSNVRPLVRWTRYLIFSWDYSVTIEAAIFDLDGTLIDTSPIQALRDSRSWRECVARASRTMVFPGVRELLQRLTDDGLKLAVVTSAVSYYADKLLAHH